MSNIDNIPLYPNGNPSYVVGYHQLHPILVMIDFFRKVLCHFVSNRFSNYFFRLANQYLNLGDFLIVGFLFKCSNVGPENSPIAKLIKRLMSILFSFSYARKRIQFPVI